MSMGTRAQKELEMQEEEARLIHESEWHLEMMRPFNFPTSTSNLISFKPKEESSSDLDPDPVGLVNQTTPQPAARRSGSGGSGGGADNVEAERRRRERLNQGFIQLSALLPELKKSDKASVLAEAASYVKKLQVRVKSLEEQTSTRGSTSNSVANVGRYMSSTIDDTNSSNLSLDDDFGISKSFSENRRLEVEARISNKEVLIKVHCIRNQEMVPRVLGEIHNLNLYIINCNAMDFGQYAMVITILAKMNEELSITAKDLAKMLQQNLKG